MSLEEIAYDTTLVRRFQAGDESAFTEIFNRYQKRLSVFVMGFLRNRSDVDEIVLKALFQAYRHLGSFRGDSALSTWLHSIARHLAINYLNSAYKRHNRGSVSLDTEVYEDRDMLLGEMLASEQTNPLEEATLVDLRRVIDVCIPQLSRDHQTVLRLLCEKHHSYEDIGLILNIPISTVKTRISRARKSLREKVDIISSRG